MCNTNFAYGIPSLFLLRIHLNVVVQCSGLVSKPASTDYELRTPREEIAFTSLSGRKFTPTPKFLGTAEVYSPI